MKTNCCLACPQPPEPGKDLCIPCSMELAHRMMAAQPEPSMLHCTICKAPFSYTEARVLRSAKDPKAGDRDTPRLCWVCARLHLSAARQCVNCDGLHDGITHGPPGV